MTAIEARGLVKRYGGFTAVDGLDLQVVSGETYALLGPNGAGKTTTIEILEGLRTRTAGEVSVLGIDPAVDPSALHTRIGVMLQEGGLYPGARVGEIIRTFAAFHADPADPEELLESVGLTDQQRTLHRRLSGGQQQRLSLAVALVGRPELVFLDEPTAGMDPVARRSTWAMIERLKAGGVTFVLTTHYLEEAEHLADRVGIIAHGRLLAEGTPEELVASGGRVRLTTERPIRPDDLAAAVGAPVAELSERRYELDVVATPATMAAVAAWAAEGDVLITELRAGSAGLEEVFIEVTGDES
jgi:ABC-2 type transport system ATP-binding protein